MRGTRSRRSRPLLASPPQAAPVLSVSSMSAWSSGAYGKTVKTVVTRAILTVKTEVEAVMARLAFATPSACDL